MSCNRTRYIALILVLLALIACANATPGDGSENFDNMDWSFIANVGEHFSGMVAHNEFAQMTTSPITGSSHNPLPNRSPPRSHPRVQPAVLPVDDHFGAVSPWGMELPDNLGLGIQNIQNPEHFRRRADTWGQIPPSGQGIHGQTTHSSGWQIDGQPRAASVPFTHNALQPNNFGPIGAPVTSGYVDPSTNVQYPTSQPWPMESFRNQPMDPLLVPNYSLVPGNPSTSVPASIPQTSPYQFGTEQAQISANVPEILSPDVTTNFNYQSGMAQNHVGMLGWIGRAPTTGDRAVPRLTTDHLAPPEPTSATRSPTSASTTGSSTGRPGSRRMNNSMPAGNLHCHWCKAAFSTQGDLTHHLRIHAPYMSRQHVCSHCEKRFQYRKDLARHLPKHDPNRQRYYCPIANCKYFTKGFGRQDHLDRHVGSQHRLREDTPQRARTPSQ